MDEVHRKVLQRNRPYLIKEVMLEPLWPHLLAREIFTDEMIEHIQVTGAKSSQMQRLLSDLCRRGPEAYGEFIECLVDTEQQHIVDKLNSTEQTLRSREPKFFTPPVMNSTTIGCSIGDTSSTSIGYSSAPTRPIHREPVSLHHSTPPVTQHATQPAANSRVPYERSASVSTTEPLHEVVSLDHSQADSCRVVSSSTAKTSSVTCITGGRPSLSFAVSSQMDHRYDRTPPRQSFVNTDADRVRRNLTTLLRSPITQTDNGDGISVNSRPGILQTGLQSTDHPMAVEVNPYPQVLGIPETSGRLKFSVQGTKANVAQDWKSMYRMSSDPRGYCIIINNRHFTGHLKERIGTDVDRDNLYMLYSQLGYQICIQENLTGMEMLLTLRDFAQLSHHKTVDSCVVILLTHGLEGQIYGSDAKLINLSEVFNFFDGNVCPGLHGKPKFFLVQACRGEKFDAGFDMCDNGQPDTTGPASQAIVDIQQHGINDINSLSRKLPSGSDFLIAYATVPGFVSWRNSEQGSWFIQAMCEVFSKQCHHEDAVTMLVQVNDRVASIYESATKHKQMPSPVVHLRKKLYFFPPESL